MARFLISLALLAAGLIDAPAQAASLSVSPIRLDLIHPGNSARLTLRNAGTAPMTAQVRVFKWSAVNGRDHFAETRDVVVSPPIATLQPRSELNVRIVRTSSAPVQGEESYRVVVDEVPAANRVSTVGVTIAIRYALPLFVLAQNAGRPQVSWAVRMINGRRALVATNSGDVHLRIANLAVGSVKLGKGLQGYVLGRSLRVFELPRNANPAGVVSADTDQGRLNAALAR